MDKAMEEQEREDAIEWYRSSDVNAYEDDGNVYVVIPNDDETHVMVSSGEVVYRAILWRENQEEEVSHASNK